MPGKWRTRKLENFKTRNPRGRVRRLSGSCHLLPNYLSWSRSNFIGAVVPSGVVIAILTLLGTSLPDCHTSARTWIILFQEKCESEHQRAKHAQDPKGVHVRHCCSRIHRSLSRCAQLLYERKPKRVITPIKAMPKVHPDHLSGSGCFQPLSAKRRADS
jgi:hypothetical protein